MKNILKSKIFTVALLAFIFLVVPITSMGAYWVNQVGLIDNAIVLSSGAASADKVMANILKPIYGDRIGICDLTADETEINAALATGYSTKLWPGAFVTASKINIPSDIEFWGAGIGRTTITGSGAGAHYQIVGNTTQAAAGNENIYIHDMSIDAAWAAGGTDSARGAVSFRYVDNVLIERVYATRGYEHNFELAAATNVTTRGSISNAPVGDDGFSVSDIGLGAVSLSSNIYYYNNQSYGVTAGTGSAFEVDDGPQYVWYIGNNAYDSPTRVAFEAHVHTGAVAPKHLYYDHNKASNVAYYMGIATNAVPSVAGDHITDVSVTNNTFTGAATEGIAITAVRDLSITGNYLETRGIGIDWYDATYYSKNLIIAKNILASDLVKTPIYVKDADFVTIQGNISSGTTTAYSIYLRALNRSITSARILDNITKNADTSGIIVQTAALLSASDILIQGNESSGADGVVTQNYGLTFTNAGTAISDVLVADNNFHDNATANVTSSGTGAFANIRYRDNTGYIAPGETRTASGTLTKTGSTLTDGSGTFTGSVLALLPGANTVDCTVAGTATIVLPVGSTGTVASGTMTVDSSPVALVAGNNTITTSGAIGNITVTINAIGFAWHNPEIQDVLVSKVVVYTTTTGGTATSVIDVGIADNAIATNRGVEFFDDIDANAADVNDSWLAGDGGSQTKWVLLQDSASATDGWVVGSILTEKANNLVGSWYVEYVGK